MSKSFRRHVGLCLLLLIVVVGLESWTDMDMAVQRLHFAHGWPVTRAMHEGWLGLGFYRGPKIALVCFGGLCALGAVLALTRPAYGHWLRPCMFMALSLALVPLLVSGGKQFTNIYCPRELTVFGGERTYQRVFAPAAPENAQAPRGKGFPAGHASGGFALMGLYFLGRSARQRRVGLAVGLAAGWSMGLYQQLRGEHFLSHTLCSMILAWLLLRLLHKFILQPATL